MRIIFMLLTVFIIGCTEYKCPVKEVKETCMGMYPEPVIPYPCMICPVELVKGKP